jgi:glycosyltransferase involved in cell wall biosynthesis
MNISVIIPTYNRATFLPATLSSVLNQSQRVDEIVVVDDGSTDNTKDVLSQYGVKYLYQANRGVSSARNLGVKNAKNEWIAFLDSDDIWHEDKIEKQIAFHTQNRDILFSHTDEVWLRDSKVVKKPKHHKKPYGNCFVDNLPFCKIGPSTVIIHKSVLEDVGYFDESLKVCEDYDLWLRVLSKYEVGLVDEELVTKTAGHNQLSFDTPMLDIYRVEALQKHIESEYQDEVKKELIRKCNVLIKGAIKHQNLNLKTKYEEFLNSGFNLT